MDYRTKIKKQQEIADRRFKRKQNQTNNKDNNGHKNKLAHNLKMYYKVVNLYEPLSDEWTICMQEIQRLELELSAM